MYLRIATELYLKRLVVGGMERVFEIGRIFRNEGIDSTHNPEFTMLEAYQALADYEEIMALIEEVFAAVTMAVKGSTQLSYKGRELDLTPPYRRARMTELVSEALGIALGLDTPQPTLLEAARGAGIEASDAWSPGRLIAEIYEAVVEDRIWEPTFVTHPPVEVSPLARRNRDDPRVADRFELVIAGSEYANAFSELNDPDDQRARFEEQAAAREAGDEEAHPVDEDYLMALEYGLPPTGGLGIGVDRLVMLLTDQHHIREVILFPDAHGRFDGRSWLSAGPLSVNRRPRSATRPTGVCSPEAAQDRLTCRVDFESPRAKSAGNQEVGRQSTSPGGIHPLQEKCSQLFEDLTGPARVEGGQRLGRHCQPPRRLLERLLDVASGAHQVDHLFDRAVRVGHRPAKKVSDPIAFRAPRREQHGCGKGAFPDIGAGGLPDRLLVGDQIEGIVGDLEHHAHLPGPRGHCLDDIG